MSCGPAQLHSKMHYASQLSVPAVLHSTSSIINLNFFHFGPFLLQAGAVGRNSARGEAERAAGGDPTCTDRGALAGRPAADRGQVLV